ncbi:response regulator [Paenibacillus hamazuiensis]|uniref:response regulator n=1 Tax=Paenibacillus hamazuiensis TaxID=2936508 RepID=UPI00200EAD58|nr:response regulator [Paenibacillus hamazuiensis]
MIQLMIVDDEERARAGIRTLIDWGKHGISIAAEARDGVEALELLQRHKVDILLTDIRMPEMDGLALIERAARQYPHIKSVIMSGYDEFAYAKKAMALGASDYLLKPSRTQEILDTILKLAAVIENERNQEKTLEQLKAGFRESFPLLKEKTLSRLVMTDNPPYDRLLSNLRINGLEFPFMFFGAMVLQIDHFHGLLQTYSHEDIELYKYGLKNIAEETMSAGFRCAAFEQQDDVVVIVNAGEWIGTEALIPYAEAIQRNIRQYLKFTVSIGIGSFEASISHLRASYREAVKALNARYYIGSAKIVDYTESVDDDPDQSSYPLVQEKAILQAVVQGDRDAILGRLEEFHDALKPDSSSKEHILKSTVALVFTLYRFCVEKNLNTSSVFGHDLTGLAAVLSQSSLEYIRSLLAGTVLEISAELNAKKNRNKLFQTALEYIGRNFHKDISRETVAREVFITPGYLSLLFKQEMKTSFLDYLHQIRIERACERLRDRSLKLSDIAHDVGYTDEKYFFQVFKKYTGMTPSQYRNNLGDA